MLYNCSHSRLLDDERQYTPYVVYWFAIGRTGSIMALGRN